MNLTYKNSSSTSNQNKKQKNQINETKKKNQLIKLSVNQFIRSDHNKNNLHKNTELLKKQLQSQSKSLEKLSQSKTQIKVVKTFEQIYYQKLKQLKLQQDHFFYQIENKNNETEIIKPHSCKNNPTVKIKTKPFLQNSQQTKKMFSKINKQNILIQQSQENFCNTSNTGKEKIQKKQISHSILEESHQIKISNIHQKQSQSVIRNQSSEKSSKIVKKILKLKKPSKLNHSQNSTNQKLLQLKNLNIQNEFKKNCLGSNHHLQKKVSNLDSSFQLTTFKERNSLFQEQKPKQLCETQARWRWITDHKIDHKRHEHIQNQTQCFFQFNQFQSILNQLGFEESLSETEKRFYILRLWRHLGGDIYGGVVRRNLKQLFSLLFEQDKSKSNDLNLGSEACVSLENSLVDTRSLKLIDLDQQTKEEIRRFYFPLKIKCQAICCAFQQNSQTEYLSKNAISNSSTRTNHSNHSVLNHQDKNFSNSILCLENNPYLDSVSHKSNLDASPCMEPDLIGTDLNNNNQSVTDFSPKLSSQQFEPFKSTVLSRFSQYEKIPTEQQDFSKNQDLTTKKALLSIDINLGEGVLEKLFVYQDQSPYEISLKLKERYNIDEQLRDRLQKMLRNHLNSLLFKIQQVSEELFEDSFDLKDKEHKKEFNLIQKD